MIEVRPLSPVGARIPGLDLDRVAADPALVDELRDLLARHGVLVFPEQTIDDAGFAVFLRAFGNLVFTEGETAVEGHPDLNLISNVGRATPPRSQFHVDSSYWATPPAYTALRAVEVPEQGGATLFTNQYLAHDLLPGPVRIDLTDRTVTHVVTGVDPGAGAERSAEHPLVRPHPRTGRAALYLSTPQRCSSVSGMGATVAAETIASLLEHSTRPANVLRHAWMVGDVVMWDNACVLHKADHSGVVGKRVMHRGMVADHA